MCWLLHLVILKIFKLLISMELFFIGFLNELILQRLELQLRNLIFYVFEIIFQLMDVNLHISFFLCQRLKRIQNFLFISYHINDVLLLLLHDFIEIIKVIKEKFHLLHHFVFHPKLVCACIIIRWTLNALRKLWISM